MKQLVYEPVESVADFLRGTRVVECELIQEPLQLVALQRENEQLQQELDAFDVAVDALILERHHRLEVELAELVGVMEAGAHGIAHG